MKERNLIYLSPAIFPFLFLPVFFHHLPSSPLMLCHIISVTAAFLVKGTYAEFLPLKYGDLGTALGQASSGESNSVTATSDAGSGKRKTAPVAVCDDAASFSSCFWFFCLRQGQAGFELTVNSGWLRTHGDPTPSFFCF